MVAFWDGAPGIGTFLGQASLNGSDVASLTLSNLAFGPHNVTASYVGDGNFLPSNSLAGGGLTVTDPAVSLAVVPPGSIYAQTPFNLTLVAQDYRGQPALGFTGTATLFVLSAPVGASVTGPIQVSFVNGVAQFTNLQVSLLGQYVFEFTAGNLMTTFAFTTSGRQT
jgi:hypothetical protein